PGRKPRCKAGYRRKGPTITPAEVERYRAYRAREAEMPSAARNTSPKAELPQVEKRGRGRPAGKRDPEVVKRETELPADWDAGKFESKRAAGRAYGFHPADSIRLINAHEAAAR